MKVKLPYLVEPCKIHIQHIVNSYFEDEQLVIFRRFVKSKNTWVEEMLYKHDLDRYKL